MKRILLIFAAVFFLSELFCQEAETPQKSADFVMQFEPALYINPESSLVSAPSPVVYPISFGFLWPNYSKIAIQPTLSFFMMNHLLYEDKAVPAEIENRTSTTLSFMLNVPCVVSFFLSNSRFQLNVGPAVFMRFGLLAHGVKSTDSGWSGSAESDVKAINGWFWNNMHWFYFTVGGSWLYNLMPQLRAGPTVSCSIPVGGLIKDKSPQGMLISVGIKICR